MHSHRHGVRAVCAECVVDCECESGVCGDGDDAAVLQVWVCDAILACGAGDEDGGVWDEESFGT